MENFYHEGKDENVFLKVKLKNTCIWILWVGLSNAYHASAFSSKNIFKILLLKQWHTKEKGGKGVKKN